VARGLDETSEADRDEVPPLEAPASTT
jgi:hypothetical protein